MPRFIVPAAAVAALVLAGCAGKFAETASDYRAQVADSSFGSVDTFTVPRRFSSVVSTFQSKAPECLKMVIRTRHTSPMQNADRRSVVQRVRTQTVRYHPTVVAQKNRLELHVQRGTDSAMEPAGGSYVLVMDAVPVDSRSTRITIYRGMETPGSLRRYVKDWTAGMGRGCPELE